ncbi:MAG: type II toxin-antitoxin system Phd/YefM family antitoxin [Candidatus Algichlamydia australiensis]|nr:type II toxin-antitoxin system Phd/YefM family antitoxin [Chlamydiales bacterium]
MNTREISARDLRDQQADILNRIAFGGAHFIVTRHGKETAVLISIDEFRFLQETMEALEDASDIADARKALNEVKRKGGKSLKRLADELGIDV